MNRGEHAREVTSTETRIQVVKRDMIPPIQSVDQQGDVHVVGELRDFSWSDVLRTFMPNPPVFSASWVRLVEAEVLQPHMHPVQSMMVVYAGGGEMIGDLRRRITEGDVIVVPPGSQHGFIGGRKGLYALSIQFGEGLYTTPERPRVVFVDAESSLASVLDYHERRLAEFRRRPLFELLSGGEPPRGGPRRAFIDALRIWSDGTLKVLLARQASCREPDFARVFLESLQGRLAMAAPVEVRGIPGAAPARIGDPVLEAIVDWFAHQMYVMENAEKAAATCLVLGSAGAVYEKCAGPVRSAYPQARNSDEHPEAVVELLRNETSQTYARLKEVVSESWDMVDAAADRIAELTGAAPSGAPG